MEVVDDGAERHARSSRLCTAVSGSIVRSARASTSPASSGLLSSASPRRRAVRAAASASSSVRSCALRRSARSPAAASAAWCASTASHSSSMPVADGRDRLEHDRPPVGIGEPEHLRELGARPLDRRMVGLVDHDDVGDLHHAGLERLDRVAGARHEDECDGVGQPGHLDLALPDADGLVEQDVAARRIHDHARQQRRLGDPAQMSARAHRADVDAGIQEVLGQPDAVAEQRAVRDVAGGVDRDHADGLLAGAQELAERRHQARLADPGRTRDAERARAPRVRVEQLRAAAARPDARPRPARSRARPPGGRPPGRARRAHRGPPRVACAPPSSGLEASAPSRTSHSMIRFRLTG